VALAFLCLAAGSANAQTVARDSATLRNQMSAAFTHAAARPTVTAQANRSIRLTPPAGSILVTPADARHAAVPVPPQGKKSFFKTPWPYVIIAVVVTVVVVAANSGGSGGGY